MKVLIETSAVKESIPLTPYSIIFEYYAGVSLIQFCARIAMLLILSLLIFAHVCKCVYDRTIVIRISISIQQLNLAQRTF